MHFRYNATSGCVGDNVVEPGDIQHMDVAFGILFLSVLFAEIVLLPVSDGRRTYLRYNAISVDIVDNTIKELDFEDMGVAVTASNSVKIGRITRGSVQTPPCTN